MGRFRRQVAVLVGVVAAVICALAPGAALAEGRCGDHPWCNTSLSPDERAGLLLAQLTQDEKVSLLGGDDVFGVAGGDHTHTGTSDGVDRVGLPTQLFSDGPVGPRQGKSTAMPIPMALAATFDPALAKLHGSTIANEVKDKGNDVVFAPTVNVMRTPLNGRTYEAYGEDPWLVAQMTVGWIEGAQSQGVIADVKHFAANNQEGADPTGQLGRPGLPLGAGTEGSRMVEDSVIDERTLREVYLPQFEAAVKVANVGTVMCSYNKVNGQYACENQHLIQDILRREWGFKGIVLADYGAAHDTAPSLVNGLDFEPWPPAAYQPAQIDAALGAGLATQQELDDHVRHILRTLFAYGFFDRAAYKDDDAQIDKPAHAAAAQHIEESAITLLRNQDKTLPLDAGALKSVAIIGKEADTFVTGGGSGAVTPFAFASPLQAIKARVSPGTKVTFDDGSDPAAAAADAKAADVAIVFANDYDTEGADRQCLSLECPDTNGDQDGLITQVEAANKKTVVVLETGGPVLTPWREQVPAILEAWYPGMEGGPAIARVLFGDVDPGGRLPATFPQSEDQLPTAGDPEKYPGVANEVTYKEGVFVGYRWYDAHKLQPAYPFGFGLSYTSFALSGLRITGGTNGNVGRVSGVIKNTGARTGDAVAELYLGLPSPKPGVDQPPWQLRGAAKRTLKPGESTSFAMDLPDRAFQYWNTAANDWQVAPGCYAVGVGTSSRDLILHGTISRGGASCGAGAVALPAPAAATHTCASRRSVVVHVRGTRGRRLRSAAVTVNGRKVAGKVVSGGGVRVVFAKRPRSTVHVRVVVRTAAGRRLATTRTYRLCAIH